MNRAYICMMIRGKKNFAALCRSRGWRDMSGSGILLLLLIGVLPWICTGQDRAMHVEDIMQFRSIRDVKISSSGSMVTYQSMPDRGDGQVRLVDETGKMLLQVDHGSRPEFSPNEKWLLTWIEQPFESLASEGEPADSVVLFSLDGSGTLGLGHVKEVQVSQDSRWLVVLATPEKRDSPGNSKRTRAAGTLCLYDLNEMNDRPDQGQGFFYDAESSARPQDASVRLVADNSRDASARLAANSSPDTSLRPVEYASGSACQAVWQGREELPGFYAEFVHRFTIDSLSTQLIYSVMDTSGIENGLFMLDLKAEEALPRRLHRQNFGVYSGFSWHESSGKLAFMSTTEDESGHFAPASLHLWDGMQERLQTLLTPDQVADGFVLPMHAELVWSKDGNRLFFGRQPLHYYSLSTRAAEDAGLAALHPDSIRATAEVDVWHWQDPLIKTHEKKTWNQRRDHTYLSVYHLERGRVVDLGSERVPYVEPADNPRYALGRNPRPYKPLITWDGVYNDYYLVDLRDGSIHEIVDRLRSTIVSHSPNGRYVAFFEAGHWFVFDADRNIIRNLSESVGESFAVEDHDYPFPAPAYGMGGWVESDRAILLYDRYDIWQVDLRSLQAWNLTAGDGRRQQIRYRLVDTRPERKSFQRNEYLLVRGFGERDKEYRLSGIRIGRESVEPYLEGPYRYRFVAACKNGGTYLYTRENYREFPDLWRTDQRFREPVKLTSENPQINTFAWGESRLVRWLDLDGKELDGVLILPGNYQEGWRYPVLVYFYEKFSQRLHHFNEQVINHRPSFPFYASNGYAVFLPDVRYDVGKPGYSATRSIVPGVNKIIEMGIADAGAIALHGHSWSGYQAAHVATQTNIFAAVIAGAPVSNMTSAYSGIRWGSGLARQFQYEQTQSRIGGSLWEKRELYIENSPVFFADRIQTPMLIMFGDQDEAVPWEQGIELYLALRRLQKEAIFLQYRGEPHHPQQYGNKLDYFLKMKEFLDVYLKGEPAPEWILDGIPYRGR